VSEISEPRDIIDALIRTLNAGDAEGVGDLFSEDAVFVSVRGTVMNGRRAIIEGHAASFAGPLAGSTFRCLSTSELPISTDVTVLHSHSLRGRKSEAPASKGPEITTVLQLVARRAGNGWEAVAASNVQEAARPGPRD
jgi:uncharacterized protein (TIGR02246 family)